MSTPWINTGSLVLNRNWKIHWLEISIQCNIILFLTGINKYYDRLAKRFELNRPKRKGKRALLSASEEENIMIKTKKLSDRIKKKEKSISYLNKTMKMIEKEKKDFKKKLKRIMMNSSEIVEEIEILDSKEGIQFHGSKSIKKWTKL